MSVSRIKNSYTKIETNWASLDYIGLPRYWATVWSFYRSSDLADSSLLKRLGYIDRFYSFADNLEYPGALDDAISEINLEILGKILEAYFIHLQNKHLINEATRRNWETSFKFLKDCLFWLSKNSQSGIFVETEFKIRKLEMFYGQLRIGTKKTQEVIRSIPANIIEYLSEILDPSHKKNPFRNDRAKWRVYVIFNLLLYQGLRSGELLNLTVDAVRNEFDNKLNKDVFWIRVINNPYENYDPRYSKPNIKTQDSIRQIPIFEWLSNLIDEYAVNYRDTPNHSYLLNSQKNNPLSYEAIKLIFCRISGVLPTSLIQELEFKTGKVSITAHDLRHTCAVARFNHLISQGLETQDVFPILRVFFGWSRSSDMPSKYAKAALIDRGSSAWSQLFDERVEFLRSLHGNHV